MTLDEAAVRCPTCGSIEIRIVDTSRTERGNWHGARCANGHPLLLLTVLVRRTKSTRVRRRFPPSLCHGADLDKGLSKR